MRFINAIISRSFHCSSDLLDSRPKTLHWKQLKKLAQDDALEDREQSDKQLKIGFLSSRGFIFCFDLSLELIRRKESIPKLPMDFGLVHRIKGSIFVG